MTPRQALHCLGLLIALVPGTLRAADLVIELPREFVPRAAVAQDRAGKQDFAGVVAGQTVQFKDVQTDASLDVRVTTDDGTVLQGYDPAWYADVDTSATAPEALSEDDVKEITSICRDIPSFYNRSDLLRLTGDRERAVALVQLIRDKAFHADKGGEIIWRVELWYFENQAGGWAKVGQSNKILRRERFAGKAEFDKDAGKILWLPQLGGLRLKDALTRIDLKSVEIKSSTPPAVP